MSFEIFVANIDHQIMDLLLFDQKKRISGLKDLF